MNKIIIEITSSPLGKSLSGIYLNDELVATEVPYIGTFAVGTLEEYSYFLNFTDEEKGKLLSVKSETSDINQIKLGESLLNIVSLPYSTNTMAKQIKLDVTDTLIQGYRFDEYNNGETLSTSQSYTHTLDPSSESETITVKTTPLWVWPVNFSVHALSQMTDEAYDFIVNLDNGEHTPVTVAVATNLKKSAKVVMATHNWLNASYMGRPSYIEIGTTDVADLTTPENNCLALKISTYLFNEGGLLGISDSSAPININEEKVNSPLMGIKGGTVVNNPENYEANNTNYTGGTLILPMSTVKIRPTLQTQQTGERSGKIEQTTIEFPKSIYLALSTQTGYTDGTNYVTISSNGDAGVLFFDNVKYGGELASGAIGGNLISVYLPPQEESTTDTIKLEVSKEVSGRSDVEFKLTTATLTYVSQSGLVDINSWSSGTPAITIDSNNNHITVSTDVFREMFGGNNMGEHNFVLSTWVTYYLTIDGEYVYKNANLTVNAESSDITKIKINDVEKTLPFSTNITLGDE